MQDSFEWLVSENDNRMGSKVGPKMLSRDDKCENNPFRIRVPDLHVMEYLASVVD